MVPFELLALLAALVIVLLCMFAMMFLVDAIRRMSYRAFEDRSEAELAIKYPIPAPVPGEGGEDRWRLLARFLLSHQGVNAVQSRYHRAVAASAACLAVGFVAMVAGTLPSGEWPSRARNAFEFVERMLTWIDVIAVLFVLLLFLYARSAGRRWFVGRVGVELLRQYQFLSAVMPNCTQDGAGVDDAEAQYAREAQRIEKQVVDGSLFEMITRITKYWSGRKAAIMSVELTDADLTADGVLVYLRRRARRQLGWFTDSKARLERAAERRFYILLGLYGIAAVIAVAKLAVSIYFNEPEDKLVECLLRILLVITGLSAAMTASYISTNARSLIHRYNTQQRRVAEWLESFNERWPFAQIPSHDSDHRDKIEMRLRILNFEELMVDELIDWLHITSQDAIELAP